MNDFGEFVNLAIKYPIQAADLVSRNTELISLKNNLGETVVHYLTIENKIESVIALVDAGADINEPDLFGSTPLINAVRLGYTKLVSYLLSKGASVDHKTVNDETALSYAVMANNIELVWLIMPLCGCGINFYINELDASEIFRNTNNEARKTIVKMGLLDPYDV